jgi:hypothetical protein
MAKTYRVYEADGTTLVAEFSVDEPGFKQRMDDALYAKAGRLLIDWNSGLLVNSNI